MDAAPSENGQLDHDDSFLNEERDRETQAFLGVRPTVCRELRELNALSILAIRPDRALSLQLPASRARSPVSIGESGLTSRTRAVAESPSVSMIST